MNRTFDCGRPALRYFSMALLGLMFGLPGCGGSKPDGALATKDPHEAERRKEMRKFMESNPQKDGKTAPRPQRNHP
jgi:hypothetical protein